MNYFSSIRLMSYRSVEYRLILDKLERTSGVGSLRCQLKELHSLGTVSVTERQGATVGLGGHDASAASRIPR